MSRLKKNLLSFVAFIIVILITLTVVANHIGKNVGSNFDAKSKTDHGGNQHYVDVLNWVIESSKCDQIGTCKEPEFPEVSKRQVAKMVKDARSGNIDAQIAYSSYLFLNDASFQEITKNEALQFLRAAASTNVDANIILGYFDENDPSSYSSGIDFTDKLRPFAESGSKLAQLEMYLHARHTPSKTEEEGYWLNVLSQSGDPVWQNEYGVWYFEYGNIELAKMWTAKAVNQNFTPAVDFLSFYKSFPANSKVMRLRMHHEAEEDWSGQIIKMPPPLSEADVRRVKNLIEELKQCSASDVNIILMPSSGGIRDIKEVKNLGLKVSSELSESLEETFKAKLGEKVNLKLSTELDGTLKDPLSGDRSIVQINYLCT